MEREPDFLISIEDERLSDNSHVYNVIFAGQKIPAISHDDAESIANKIADAINWHSVADAKIRW